MNSNRVRVFAALLALATGSGKAFAATLRMTNRFATGQQPIAIGAADLNRDGALDVVTANDSGTLTVLIGDGTGTLKLHAQYDVGEGPDQLLLSDLNRDGIPDVIVGAPQSFTVLLGNGDGTLRKVGGPYVVPFSLGQIAAADMDRDGRVDLVVAAGDSVAIMAGDGTGSFRRSGNFAACNSTVNEDGIGADVSFVTGGAVGDFNGDGLPDVAVSCSGYYMNGTPPDASTIKVAVIFGYGDGTLGPPIAKEISGEPVQLETADLDGDGNLDILVQMYRASEFYVLYGTGRGTFDLASYSHGRAQHNIVIADFNGDGRLDVGGAGDGGISVLINNGSRTFGRPFGVNGWYLFGCGGDFNNDGRPDLVAVEARSSNVAVFLNGPADVTVSMTPVPMSAAYGVPIQLRTEVSAASTGFEAPTGSVSWVEGGVLLGNSPLSLNNARAAATLEVKLPPGEHSVVAKYSGQDNPAQSAALILRVARAQPVIALSSSNPSPVYGQAITIFAVLSPAAEGGERGGTVTFSDNNNSLATLSVNTAAQVALSGLVLGGGEHTVGASYSGDSNYLPAASALSLTVQRAPSRVDLRCNTTAAGIGQTITCNASVPQSGATGTVQLLAGGSALGLAALDKGTALLAFAVAAIGNLAIQASYSGDANYEQSTSAPLSLTVCQPVAITSAAWASPIVAPLSIVSMYGVELASVREGATSNPPPHMLAGISVSISDAGGAVREAPLFFASPGQINLLVPEMPPGPATFTVKQGETTTHAVTAELVSTAPGLFSATADGNGTPAGMLLIVHADGSRDTVSLADCDASAGCRPHSLQFGRSEDAHFLILFGTGLRLAKNVNVTVGGDSMPIAYVGPQPEFSGLDQVNVRLERGLAGRGEVELLLTADGQPANRLKLKFE